MSGSDVRLWSPVENSATRVRTWQAESVLFDSRRGDTHLLSGIASCVLQELRLDSACSVEELAALIARRLGRAPDASLRAEVGAALHRLKTLDLVETTPV